jgi:hypothetical protein
LSSAAVPRPRVGLLFDFDWDALAHARLEGSYEFRRDGFDLFSFPSNARLIGFDLDRFARRQAVRAKRDGWVGVLSHHEQFGALAAALTAERAGLGGPRAAALVACQHKLHARRVLQRVAPEACPRFEPLDARYGEPIPDGVRYPCFAKPVKAAFSVLARRVDSRRELEQHTRFGRRELWVIRHLVEPFERVSRRLLPQAGTAHRLLLEEPVRGAQYNLDGWVRDGQVHVLGFVDSIMYPGTQAFMRFELPSRLPGAVRDRAVSIAQRFLTAVGFDQGFFNMEFIHDMASGRLSVVEFNPRLASQFGDLYRRVQGVDAHEMALGLACGDDPAAFATASTAVGSGAAAASFVFRAFAPADVPPMPSAAMRAEFARVFPDALLFVMPKTGHSLARDFKWLGSQRYGIVHLSGRDPQDLRQRCAAACQLLGWPLPYDHAEIEPRRDAALSSLQGALT